MIEYLKKLFSESGEASIGRVGFAVIIIIIIILSWQFTLFAIVGLIFFSLKMYDLLQLIVTLIGVLIGSGIVSKQLSKYFETKQIVNKDSKKITPSIDEIRGE